MILRVIGAKMLMGGDSGSQNDSGKSLMLIDVLITTL
jgi:hypothetical protein